MLHCGSEAHGSHSRRGYPQAAEGIDERAYWAAVLPGAVADHDAQVPIPSSPISHRWCAW